LETKLCGILGEYGLYGLTTLHKSLHQPANFGTKHKSPKRPSIFENRLSRNRDEYKLSNWYRFDMCQLVEQLFQFMKKGKND